jgi:nucleoid-associated protein YgaU
VQQTPVQQAPVQQAPVQQTPVQQTPVQQAPVQQTPVQQTPVQQAPTAAVPRSTVPVPATPPRAPPVEPSFDVVRVAADGMAVIAGRAEPGATVIVLDGETEIARAVADQRGEWVVIPARPLAGGTRELSLLVRAPGDATGRRSDRVVVVVVPERQRQDGAPAAGSAVAVAVPRDPQSQAPSRVLQAPAATAGQAAALPLTLETIDYDQAGEVVLSGRAPAGATLQVYLDGRPIGRATADPEGRWTLRPENPVRAGVYTLRVDQFGADGRVAQRIELPFARAEAQPEPGPAVERIVVQPGNSLWRIARRVYGAGTRYTVIYEANKRMIRDPDLIYPGQVFSLPDRR